MTQDIEQWGKWIAWVSSSWFQWPLLSSGTLAIAVSLSYWFSDYRIANRGGSSGREHRAHFDNWDKVDNIAVWQVAWLWNGLEPQKGNSEGTPAYSTFQRLKEHLGSGLIPDVQRHDGSWVGTRLDRQKLVDYALEIGERPRFLFSKMRVSFFRRLISLFFARTYPFNDAKNHPTLSECRTNLIVAGLKEIEDINSFAIWGDQTSAEIDKQIVDLLKQGETKTIGRKKIGGLLWDYEKIHKRSWRRLSPDYFSGAASDKIDFGEIRVLIETDYEES